MKAKLGGCEWKNSWSILKTLYRHTPGGRGGNKRASVEESVSRLRFELCISGTQDRDVTAKPNFAALDVV
jgi:hypothetical protein